MDDNKINQLKKIISNQDDGLELSRPNLETMGPAQKQGLNLQLGQNFSEGNRNLDAKALKDPKGKNKQILKGNAKSRR